MTKKVFALPVFRPEEYQAFRREVGANLADTYDEWAKAAAEQRDEAIRQGKSLVDIEVHYDEFIRHCRATGEKADPKTLLAFAVKRIPRDK